MKQLVKNKKWVYRGDGIEWYVPVGMYYWPFENHELIHVRKAHGRDIYIIRTYDKKDIYFCMESLAIHCLYYRHYGNSNRCNETGVFNWDKTFIGDIKDVVLKVKNKYRDEFKRDNYLYDVFLEAVKVYKNFDKYKNLCPERKGGYYKKVEVIEEGWDEDRGDYKDVHDKIVWVDKMPVGAK